MQSLSYLNVTNSHPKMMIGFLYAVFIIPLLGFRLIILYHHKYKYLDECCDHENENLG